MYPYAGRNAPTLPRSRAPVSPAVPRGFPAVGGGLGGLPTRGVDLNALRRRLFGYGVQGALFMPSLRTCYTDDGSTLCTRPGDLVYRIDDLSGNGNHTIQSTEALRPKLQQNAGGLWYLEFDGINDFMVLPNIPFSSDTGVEVYGGLDTANLGADYALLVNRTSAEPSKSFSAYLGTASGNFAPAIYNFVADRAVNVSIKGRYVGVWRLSLLSGSTRRAITRVNRNQVSSDYSRDAPTTGEVITTINSSIGIQLSRVDLYGLVVRCAPLLSDAVSYQTEAFMAERIGIALP